MTQNQPSECGLGHLEEQRQEPPRKNWWGRNWKWFLPVGILLPIALCAGGITLMVGMVMGMLKSSEAFERSFAAATNHPALVAAIGEPIEAGRMVTGQLHTRNDTGNADIRYTVHGPKGQANVHAVGSMTGGVWTMQTMEAVVQGSGEVIDLSRASPARGP